MAKEFKRFDKEFKNTKLVISDRHRGLALHKTQWSYAVIEHSQQNVRNAVYEAEGHLDWQRFRVGLKGLTTAMKLVLLEDRYLVKVIGGDDFNQRRLEKIRIDNYIGALRRGGLLDADNKVIK